jgi:hypothetical protein
MEMQDIRNIEYLDPMSPNTDKKLYVPAVGELKDKRIGFVTNGWSSYNAMGARIEEVFRERHGIRDMHTYTIPTSCAPPEGLLEQIATECDAAIVGMAN